MAFLGNGSNLILIYFIYGLAFFCMGLVMTLETQRSPVLAEARLLIPLAAFGYLHGAHEWLEMYLIAFGQAGGNSPPTVIWVRLVLLISSFSCLVVFGFYSHRPQERHLSVKNWYAVVGLLSAYLAVLALTAFSHPFGALHWAEHADALARYLLAVPGAILAAVALGRQAWSARQLGRSRVSLGMDIAAWSFGLYGLSQVIVPAVDLFPAPYLNAALFLQWTGVPVQAFRAILAVLVIVGLTRAVQGAEDERQNELVVAQQARLQALQQVQRDLEEKVALRREVMRHTVIAQEEERARVARELHDETAQYLTALSLELAAVQNLLPQEARLGNGQLDAALLRMQTLGRKMSQGIYRLVRDLRPAQLDDLGLSAAINHLVDEASRSARLEVAVESSGLERRLDPLVETVLFRVAQEALANVARHAGSGRARLDLHAGTDLVTLRVRDEGVGFNPEAQLLPPQGWGIAGMRERVEAVGGLLHIQSAPGRGTLVEASIPLRETSLGEIEEGKGEFDTVDAG